MIDCSKTKNYFAEKQRITKKHKLNGSAYICGLNCTDCPLSSSNNGIGVPCTDFEMLYPKQAIASVQKWSDEHPPKTYLSKLLKIFSNIPLGDDRTPNSLCPFELGLMRRDDCRANCIECWNQPVENGEEGEEND